MREADEIRRALKLLEALIKAHGLTKKALDQKLQKGPGYISQVLTGRLELKYRHILEILEGLDMQPGLFFRALFLEPETPSQSGRMLEKFLEGLQKMGYYGERASTAEAPPAAQSQTSAVDAQDLDRRIRDAVADALSERGGARRHEVDEAEARARPDHREGREGREGREAIAAASQGDDRPNGRR
jgi:hypothetical protein